MDNQLSKDKFWESEVDVKKVEKKKNNRVGMIVAAVVVCVIAFIVVYASINVEVLTLNVIEVRRGDVTETHSASGTIGSEQQRIFFSPVSARISQVNVQVGDRVRAGDLIIAYDLSELEINNEHTELQLSAAIYNNQAAREAHQQEQGAMNAEQRRLNDRAATLQQEINEIEAEIERLRQEEEAESNRLEIRFSEVQIELTENRTLHAQRTIERGAKTLQLQELTITLEERNEIRAEIAELDEEIAILDNDSRALEQELESIQREQINLSNEERLLLRQDLVGLRTELANLNLTNTTAEIPELAEGQIQSMQVSEELLELSRLSAEELLEQAEEGIRAEFDGIIASLRAAEGIPMIQGGELFTLVNNQAVFLKLEIPADEFDRIVVGNEATIQLGRREYHGKVERVNQVAMPNIIGQMMIEARISIENPDEHVFVGVPARAVLTVDQRQDVLYLPGEVINTTAEGNFVYILTDGVVERRPVELGIISNSRIEVLSGVVEGELVVSESMAFDLEGVRAVPQLRE